MLARVINIFKYQPKQESIFIEGFERKMPEVAPKGKQITFSLYANEAGNFVNVYETPKKRDYIRYGKITQIEQFNTMANADNFTVELENKVGAIMLNDFISIGKKIY